jgi:hypothetical protein
MLGTVLVSDFIQIERPFAAVRDELLASGGAWLADDVVAAYAEGEQLGVTVRSALGPVKLSKRVWAELTDPSPRADRVIQRLRWRAAGATGLFPTMEADLEFSPMGEGWTSISFLGRYDPPLGLVGREVDRMLLHRLAEASVRSLLGRVAQRVGAPAESADHHETTAARAEGGPR